MRTDKKRGKELPEFNAEYIDKLFSQDTKGKTRKIPAPAEEAFRRTAPEEVPEEPKPKKSRRKPVLLLAAVALIVLLCLLLPDPIANLRSGYWQTRAADAYDELMSEELPFLIVVQRYHESEKASEESTVTHWHYGNDYLTIESSKEKTTHLLTKDNRIFKKTVTPDNPNGRWKPVDIILDPGSNTPNTFSNLDHALPSIRATLLRVDVTFTQVNSSGVTQTICFHFNPFGKLLGINTTIAGDTVSRQQNLTVLSTNPEKIKSAIQKAYNEATGKE